MATATIRAVSIFLALLFAMQAHLNAASLADDANGTALAGYSGNASVQHTTPQSNPYMPSRTLRIPRRDGGLSMDRADSCNYTTRVRNPGVSTSTDGLPRPVACWAHRWNSGLQTNY